MPMFRVTSAQIAINENYYLARRVVLGDAKKYVSWPHILLRLSP